MTRYPWVLAAITLAAAPWACTVTLEGNGTPGGTGHFGSGGSGSGNGGAGGGGTGGGTVAGDACNPVTSAGCPADGSTCDLDTNSGYFACFPPPNDVNVCGGCDDDVTFCGADLTCVFPENGQVGTCYRYCCTDADCGAGGACDTAFGAQVLQPTDTRDKLGLCVVSTASEDAACGPPATSPSGGACVGGFSGNPGSGSSDAGSPDSGGGHHDGGGHADAGEPGDGGAVEPGDAGTREPGDAGAVEPGDAGDFVDAGHGGRHDGGRPHDGG